MPNPLQVDQVHLAATAPTGEALALVSYTNGRIGLTRDGHPVPGLDWSADQLDTCVAALARLAGLTP